MAFGDDPQQLSRLDHLHPFTCGLDTTDLGAVNLAIKRIQEFPGVWEGVGELMSRHDLRNLSTGERPRGNHSSLGRLFKFLPPGEPAAQHSSQRGPHLLKRSGHLDRIDPETSR